MNIKVGDLVRYVHPEIRQFTGVEGVVTHVSPLRTQGTVTKINGPMCYYKKVGVRFALTTDSLEVISTAIEDDIWE